MDEFDDAFDTCKSRFPDEDMLRSAMRQVGFDSAVASNFSKKTICVLDVVAAQFKELMRHGESLKASDAESMVMADDVRRIMLGEAKLSVYVEAKSRGFPRWSSTRRESAGSMSTNFITFGRWRSKTRMS